MALSKLQNFSTIGKIAFLFFKELSMFLKSLFNDGTHLRNIMYLWVSIYATSDAGMIFNALLLLDIINKIKSLNQVLSIFNENKVQLASTLALFAVLLYICAFYSF